MRKICLGIALAALVLAPTGTALAGEPSSNASCTGAGSSWAGQLGTRDNVAHATQAFAELTGVTPGYLVTTAARDHGSLNACFGL